jgi:hypothetical protein
LSRALPWLRKLGWKKWLLVTGCFVIIIILVLVVTVPMAIYYSRNRKPPDYSGTLAQATAVYSVTYDSGDGFTDNSTFTRKVLDTGVKEDSQICFRVVTEYDPYPYRKVKSILGSMKPKLAQEEVWRNRDDLRVVKTMSMETDIPALNTVKITSTYSEYDSYPVWPYHLGNSWTYQVVDTPDSPLQKPWTNSFRADVVSDNAMIRVGDKQYQCFEVVHTLTDTTSPKPGGAGVGGAITQYWYTGEKTMGPIKEVDSLNYMGTEIETMTGEVPLSLF